MGGGGTRRRPKSVKSSSEILSQLCVLVLNGNQDICESVSVLGDGWMDGRMEGRQGEQTESVSRLKRKRFFF